MVEHEVIGCGSERCLCDYQFRIEYIESFFVILSVIVAKKECKIPVTVVMRNVNRVVVTSCKKTYSDR